MSFPVPLSIVLILCLNKLLPYEVQLRQRIKTIERGTGKDIYPDGKVGNQVDDPSASGQQDRHNQIVACIFGKQVGLLGIPIPCAEKGIFGEIIDKLLTDELRLSSWEGDLSAFFTRKNTWNKRIPPLPSDFAKNVDYRNALSEWRGKSCTDPFTIPFLGIETFLCADNPLRPNFWANLFPYVPFSSTEDRKGEVNISQSHVQPTSDGVTITNVALSETQPSTLNFAHMEEVSELAQLLQKIHVSKGKEEDNEIDYNTIAREGSEYCSLAKV